MKIIALTGPKMVGKSTVANAIADAADVPTHIMSFADPMRSMLQALGVRYDSTARSIYERKSRSLGLVKALGN